MKHIRLFENFNPNPFRDLINNTYPTDDGYEVYFDNEYIELSEGGKIVSKFTYPELGDTVSDGQFELYLDSIGDYLEFILDDKIVTTLYLNEI